MASGSRQRAEALFHELMELPLAERSARLNAACGGDAELAAAAGALLAAAQRVPPEFMHAPSATASGAAQASPHRVGRYEIVRKVGEGGMGVVYEARQDNPRRTVALKLMRSDLLGPRLARRFEHESQLLGRLQHPGIARIYEAGTADVTFAIHAGPATEDETVASGGGAAPPAIVRAQPYFAMEFVHGQTLTAYAERHGLGTRARMELLAHVCDAVQYAHASGVVHRDLKPGNILVDDLGQPRILDFGIARMTGGDAQTLTLQTEAGQLLGTLPYMSPEQVGGDPGEVDHLSDVYALGVVAWELLVGRLPYDVRRCSLAEAARIIREEEPTRISQFNPRLRGDVETILRKSLEKEKRRRYASVGDLAADIRRYLHDEPLRARPVSTWYQLRKFSRRHRGLVAGLGAAVLMLMVGVVVSLGFALYAYRQRAVAESRTAEVIRQAYRTSIAAASSALHNDDVRGAQTQLAAAPAALRGWEWRYLHAVLNRSLMTFDEPAGQVLFLAITADRRFVVSGSADGRFRRWDLRTGEVLASLETASRSAIELAALRSDGLRLLVPDDAAGEVVLWDFESGAQRWRRPRSPGQSGDFSPDGKLVALPTASANAIELIDVESGATQATLADLSQLSFARFGPDGQRILCGYANGCKRILLRDSALPPFELCEWNFELDRTWTRCLIWPPGRPWQLRTVPDGRLIAETAGAFGAPVSVRFTNGDLSMLTIEQSGVVTALDHRLTRVSRFFGPPEAQIWAVVPDDPRFVTVGRDGAIQVWDARTPPAPFVVPTQYAGAVVAAAVSPRADATLIGGWGDLALHDVSTGGLLWRRTLGRQFLTAVAFHPVAPRLACIDGRGRVAILDRDSGEIVAEHQELGSAGFALCWLAGRNEIVTGQRDGRLAIISADGAAAPRYLDAHANPIHCLARSADESLLASGSGADAENKNFRGAASSQPGDNSIIIWDTARWSPRHHLTGHSGPVVAAAFHPDGVRLATADMQGSIRIWNARTGAAIGAIDRSGESRALAFTPDGRRLAAVGVDGIVRVWDAETADELLNVRTVGLGSLAAAFSPGGQTLLTAGANAAVMALETQPSADVAERARVTWIHHAVTAATQSPGETPEDLAARVESDSTLPSDVRAAAVAYIRARGGHANYMNSEAISEAGGMNGAATLSSARRKIAAALQILPDDPGFLATCGGVLCRQGEYAPARAALLRSNERYAARGMSPVMDNWAFLAIACHHLGRPQEASAAFAALQAAAAESAPHSLEPAALLDGVRAVLSPPADP